MCQSCLTCSEMGRVTMKSIFTAMYNTNSNPDMGGNVTGHRFVPLASLT